MSYILDALRKADAERERGSVPGIHAQPVFAGAPASAAARSGVPAWAWIGAAVLVLGLAAVAAWAWLGNGSTPPAVARSAAPPVVAAPPAPTAAPVTAAVPAAPAPTPGPTTAAVATAPTAAAASAAPAARKPTVAAAPPKPMVAEARPAPMPASPASAKAGDTYDENRVYSPNELPAEIRSQLPAVSVGGSMYSAKKADRILIINGLVLHEGDAVAPGLMLEQIRLKAAVLAFKGYRYAIAF
jgi:general secretion pathway protein B